ncbi:MAG: hypothetical protein AAGC71_01735 [Pseudomonadota bacterium]
MSVETVKTVAAAKERLLSTSDDGSVVYLHDPIRMPLASGFLWNRQMLVRVNCRGYVDAQFMQPEPSSYSRGPVPEATTFAQPEMGNYTHRAGRFVYIKDEDSAECFSVPHEPMRDLAETFEFSVAADHIDWRLRKSGLTITWQLRLAGDDVAEKWLLIVENTSDRDRALSIYPMFSIGYMSWMNQSASFDSSLNAVVARSVPPYQKLDEQDAAMLQKAWTFLCADQTPDAFETIQAEFEGEGGLQRPSALHASQLGNGEAAYEVPIAAMQFRVRLARNRECRYRFLFGPANDTADIKQLRQRHGLGKSAFGVEPETGRSPRYGVLQQIVTPSDSLNAFTEHWLARQIAYLGDLQRLSTDPQTRNFLQDALGQLYVDPSKTRSALLQTLSQQQSDGALPDGILINAEAELKYINKVPHTDHAVWLPIVLSAYIDETADVSILESLVCDEHGIEQSVYQRTDRAVDSLLKNVDSRSLSLIGQGDWCDPMNRVGHDGRGVSSWLSMATVVAVQQWSRLCRQVDSLSRATALDTFAERMTTAIHAHFWADDRYARGITDAGRRFGTSADDEGRIFLNAQSWAMLAGVPSPAQTETLLAAVDTELETDFGPMLLAPAYTQFVDDIGRLTQKHPGYAENGSIYNHAVMFYVYALYRRGYSDRAYDVLSRSLPIGSEADLLRRGQLPVFVPNYYRGAVHQFPRTAGRSSQLINTGAASWCYRVLVEELFGLRGTSEGLDVNPQLPSSWPTASIQRRFRGATVHVDYMRHEAPLAVYCAGTQLDANRLSGVVAGEHYHLDVRLPRDARG